MSVRVGLDIGGTKTAALVADGSGPLVEVVRPTDVAAPERLVAGVVATVTAALAQIGPERRLIGVGAGVPGQVDPQRGTVRMAVNLNLREPYPLRDALEQALGVPVALENDVRAAALGAFHWARGVAGPDLAALNSLAYLSIGTGIAAGLVLDGRLYRGAQGMAGEIGHVPIDPAGPRCVCGQYGCLEAMAAGPAIAAQAAELLPGRRPSTPEVYALAAAGQPDACLIVERAAGYLSRAIYLLFMTYDVELVALGGGVSQAGAAFEQPLRRAMAALRANSPLSAAMMPDDKVVIIPYDFNAGARGAVFLAPAPSPASRQGG
jgi:glucokinase